jgi:murein DD-endopeptidase MepM/ murein hydrolase activator NlpD
MSTNNITPTVPSIGTEQPATRAEDRARLATLAAEFESLLLTNVLREMRTSGRWSDEGSSSEGLGASAYGETFDVELSRSLSSAGGLGLSKWLMNAFDAISRARDASARMTDTGAGSNVNTGSNVPAADTTTRASAALVTSARTGWNGLKLDAPAAGSSGAQWGGFNSERALAGGDDSSVKDAFYRWTYGLDFNPAGKSKEEVGSFLKANIQSAREYGLNILDVQGEQILVETEERGLEWVDVVAAAGSPNPGDTKWQWLCLADEGRPTGGGALGLALTDLRSAPGGQDRARALLASSTLTGDALLVSLRTEAANAHAGISSPVTSPVTSPSPGAPTTPESPAVMTWEELLRPSAAVTSDYGWRRDPFTGATSFHRGVDLRAALGDPVSSSGAGRVVFSGTDGGYGTSVIIEHADGLRTRYAHLSAALVSIGDEVAQGQRIGLAGQSGRATAPHVHYEVLADGRAVDPLR